MPTRDEKIVAARHGHQPLPALVAEIPSQVACLGQHLAHTIDLAERPQRSSQIETHIDRLFLMGTTPRQVRERAERPREALDRLAVDRPGEGAPTCAT